MSENILQAAIDGAEELINYDFGTPMVVLEKVDAEIFLSAFKELSRAAEAIECMVESPDNMTTQMYERDFARARNRAIRLLGEAPEPAEEGSPQHNFAKLVSYVSEELAAVGEGVWLSAAVGQLNRLMEILFNEATKQERNEWLESRHRRQDFIVNGITEEKDKAEAKLKMADGALSHLADELQGRLEAGDFGQGHFDTVYWRQLISVAKDPKELVTLEDVKKDEDDNVRF